MDLYQIRYFLTIVEVGSFTKAAEQLYVSQPSLSAGIKKLEQELGMALLERGGRTILLTPAGKLFKQRALSILAEYQAVHQDLESLKAEPTLRIGTLHTIRGSNMARLMGIFKEQYPQVIIEIFNGDMPELQNWLEQGKVDLIVSWFDEDEKSKVSQFLFHQPLALAVSNDHQFAQAKSLSLTDLDGQPYIERVNCEFWKTCPDFFKMADVKPRKVYAANNEEWVISLIQAGMGMSIMPVWKDLINTTYVPLVDLSLSRAIGLQWRRQQRSDSVDWFREFAVEHDWLTGIA